MAKALADKRFAWIPGLSVAAAAVAICGVLFPGSAQRIDEYIYDRTMRASSLAPASDIAIVAIDDASLSKLGAWPWSGGVHAQLLQRLQAAGAPVVAFTMPLGETPNSDGLQQLRAAIDLLKSDDLGKSAQGEQLRKMLDSSVADFDQNSLLASAISNHGNVLLPVDVQAAASPASQQPDQPTDTSQADTLQAVTTEKLYATSDAEPAMQAYRAADVQTPPGALAVHAHGFGFTIAYSRERVQRSTFAALRVGSQLMPSLGLAVSAAMHGQQNADIKFDDEARVMIGPRHLQLEDDLSWRPAFFPVSGARSIPEHPYWRVLAGEVGPEQLRGKTIIVGFTDTAAIDGQRLSPLGFTLTPARLVANAAASIELDRNYQQPGWAFVFKWLLVIGVLAIAARGLPSLGATIGIVVAVLGIAVCISVQVASLSIAAIWLQTALPALALFGAVLGTGSVALFKRLRVTRGQGADAVESLRMLGLTFQGQGQLDLAYETFRRCPTDAHSMDLMYGIGQDYERRRQFGKAGEVYAHLSSLDTGYKDVVQRRDRMRRADIAQAPAKGGKPGTARDAAKNEPPTIPLPLTASSGSRKQTLGRYEIERELGKGAMGVVYLGRDPKINRVVAIKAIALAEEFAEDDLADARARFFREAEMAGRLNHPGIVTVYDAGEDRGLAFIAMEYLRGEHLSTYAESIHLLPVERVLSLAARVAEALDYAHKQNVVHRDIKPANIMFNKDSDDLKITDFGIARLTDTSRTKTGIVLGTPSFMSPEQLEGRPLDGRSDLFGLGITLYQLLTGQLPFRADSMTRLMQKIATEPHVPLRSLRPELPDMAEQIVTRALSKTTVDRFQTGAEMAMALRNCLRVSNRREAVAR
ncbi:MAG TPA: serine/threonine-protein kinase [Steroidobacteraceae bacterium]|nr:serine/threonine-protein kinase [Steroidobacteraceae bacterium]